MPTPPARSASLTGPTASQTIGINEQLREVRQYETLVVKVANGNVVRLSAIASVEQSVRNSRSAAWFNAQPSVLLVITKQGDANVIDTVDQIRELSARAQALDSGRYRVLGPFRPHPDHPRQHSRHAAHAARHHRAGDDRGVRCSCGGRRRRSPRASPCRCRWREPAPRCGSRVSRSTICR